MFNTKNIIIIIVSATVAALFSQLIVSLLIPLTGLMAFLLNGFLALILMQLLLSIKTESLSKTITDLKKTKSSTITKKASDSKHETGSVKWFDSSKGYGFITRDMGDDIFVHFRSIKGNGYRSLREGQAVKFIVTQGSKGPQAEDIHVIK